MKIKKIISLIESLNPQEIKLLVKLLERRLPSEVVGEQEKWKWGKILDFRFISSKEIISSNDESKREIYHLLNDLDEEEWDEYVNDLAKYGVSIEYDIYGDEFKIFPSII